MDELDFAKRLKVWYSSGFKDLGDSEGYNTSNTIAKVSSFRKNWSSFNSTYCIANNLNCRNLITKTPKASVQT